MILINFLCMLLLIHKRIMELELIELKLNENKL